MQRKWNYKELYSITEKQYTHGLITQIFPYYVNYILNLNVFIQLLRFLSRASLKIFFPPHPFAAASVSWNLGKQILSQILQFTVIFLLSLTVSLIFPRSCFPSSCGKKRKDSKIYMLRTFFSCYQNCLGIVDAINNTTTDPCDFKKLPLYLQETHFSC